MKQKLDSYLVLDEWKTVIYNIYENEDAKYIESKVYEFMRNSNKVIDSQNYGNKNLNNNIYHPYSYSSFKTIENNK